MLTNVSAEPSEKVTNYSKLVPVVRLVLDVSSQRSVIFVHEITSVPVRTLVSHLAKLCVRFLVCFNSETMLIFRFR